MTRKTPVSLTLALPLAALALSGALAANAGAQTSPSPSPSSSPATVSTSPVSGDADSTGAAAALDGQSGHDVYMRVCAACHMPDAQGAVGAGFYPALAENPRLISSRYPAYVVINGMNGMPSMADLLTDDQAADVVNYIRTNFGNTYSGPITPAEIAALR